MAIIVIILKQKNDKQHGSVTKNFIRQ